MLSFNTVAQHSVRGLQKGSDFTEACAGSPENLLEFLRRCSGTRGPLLTALSFFDINDQPVDWRCDGGLAHAANGDSPAKIILRLSVRAEAHASFLDLKDQIATLNRELHHRAQLQQDLERALHAKDVLLAEVNHRVKNNLQVIISMLSLASGETAGPAAFRQAANRIRAMGKVHELLYATGILAEVDAPQLVSGVAQSVGAAHMRHEIRIDVECDPFSLSPETATSLALLVNELVSNAFNAFPKGLGGSIRIALHRDHAGSITLAVTDDGDPVAPAITSGIDTRVARALAEKLGGELHIVSEPANSTSVVFPGK